jgi:hypothetical protein
LEAPSLLAACGIAFTAVFLVLGVLALIIQLITVAFPAREERTDPALVAAIASSVAALAPGARVTSIEEEP